MPEWKAGAGLRIEKLYAWVVEAPDGEGVVGGTFPGQGLVPYVGADRARIESYRESAMELARATGYPVRLKMFSGGVVIDDGAGGAGV